MLIIIGHVIGICVFCVRALDVIRPGSFRHGVTKLRRWAAYVAAICMKVIGESDYDVFNKGELELECEKAEAWITSQAILERFRVAIVGLIEERVTVAHAQIVGTCGECTDGCTDDGLCEVCVDFKEALETEFGCTIQNADVSVLRKKPWEVCKLCLPPAYADTERIEDVDCSGLLELMSNCKVVCDQLSASSKEYRQAILDMLRESQWDKSIVLELVTCTVIVLDDILGSEQAIDDIQQIQAKVYITGFDIRKLFRVAVCRIADEQQQCCVQKGKIDTLHNETTRNKETINKLRNENRQHQNTIEEFRDQNASQGDKIIMQYHQISGQRDSLSELQGELQRKENTIYQLQDENSTQERKVVELHEHINTLYRKIDDLKEENKQKHDAIMKSQEITNKLQFENVRKQDIIDKLRNTTNELEEEENRKQDQIDKLKDERNDHQTSIEKMKIFLKQNQEQMKMLENDKQTMKQEDKIKRAKVKKLEEIVDKMKTVDARKQEKIDGLEKTLDKMEKEDEIKQEKIDNLEKTLDKMEKEDEIKQGKIDNLEKTLDKMEKEDEIKQGKIDNLEKTLDKMEKEDEIKQEKIDNLEKTLDRANREDEIKQGKIDNLEKTLDKMEKEDEIKQGKIDNLEKTLDKMEKEDEIKQGKIDNLEKTLHKMQKHIKMKEEVKKLETTIKQLQQRAKDGYIDESALGSPETGYWLKGQLILRKFRDGVAPFVDVCASDFHKLQYSSSDGQCIPSCSRGRPRGVLCATCYQMKAKLEKMWTPSRGKITWENTSTPSKRWQTPVALLKCYMPPGYDQQESIDDIDSAGMLAVMNNCPYIFDMLSPNVTGGHASNMLIDMKEIRNDLMHSPKLECEEHKLDKLVKKSVAVLEDKPLKDKPYSDEAIQGIKKIQKSSSFKVDTILALLNQCRGEIVRQKQCIDHKDDVIVQQENDNEEDKNKLKEQIKQLKRDHDTKCIPKISNLEKENRQLKHVHDTQCMPKINDLEKENRQLKHTHDTECIPKINQLREDNRRLKQEHETRCIPKINKLEELNRQLEYQRDRQSIPKIEELEGELKKWKSPCATDLWHYCGYSTHCESCSHHDNCSHCQHCPHGSHWKRLHDVSFCSHCSGCPDGPHWHWKCDH